MKHYEVIEEPNGFWIIDDEGYHQGPYETSEDAVDDIPPSAQVQYQLFSSSDQRQKLKDYKERQQFFSDVETTISSTNRSIESKGTKPNEVIKLLAEWNLEAKNPYNDGYVQSHYIKKIQEVKDFLLNDLRPTQG